LINDGAVSKNSWLPSSYPSPFLGSSIFPVVELLARARDSYLISDGWSFNIPFSESLNGVKNLGKVIGRGSTLPLNEV
jgi:hypothetical protein